MTDASQSSFAVVLAAGGKGLRMGTADGAPKQFILLNGIPIYVWSVSRLLAHSAISRAVIAAPPHMVTTMRNQLAAHASLLNEKPVYVIDGGETRQQSVFLGLKRLKQTPVDYVLIHDAARPFLTRDLIDRTIDGVINFGACTVAIPCSDTLKNTRGEQVYGTVSRENIALVQTPQAARFDWLLAAHEKCEREGVSTTDDASVLEHSGHSVGIVRGSSQNIKITQPDDLNLAKALASIVLQD